VASEDVSMVIVNAAPSGADDQESDEEPGEPASGEVPSDGSRE